MGKAKSSLNLFLVLPIFIFLSLGCICSGSGNYQGCVTPNDETVVLAQSKIHFVKYSDGTISESRPGSYENVLCSSDNGVIAIDKQTKDQRRAYDERTARWQTAAKNYKLTNDEFFEKHTGFIQDRYFVSSSRGYIVKSYSTGGKNSRTVHYRVYTQPQVFTLEDSAEGKVKSHHLTKEKLGLPESVFYDDLRFYALGLSPAGWQTFAVINNPERTVKIYQMDMFSGDLKQNFFKNNLPVKDSYENIAFDKSGKFLAYALKNLDGRDRIVKTVYVLNLETDSVVFTRDFADVSFSDGTPTFMFDETGGKLAVVAEGFKFDPQTKIMKDLFVFDLENGNVIADFNLEELFKKPEEIQAIHFKNGDFLFTRTHKPATAIFKRKDYLCRLNTQTGQTIWDVELPE